MTVRGAFPLTSVASYDNGIPYDAVYDNSGPDSQPLYEGTAYPATAITSPYWKIRKYFYDSNSVMTGWRWADGSTNFDKDWSLRASYTYATF